MNALKQWWQSITLREQRLVMLGLPLLFIGFCYWGVWRPLEQRIDLRQQQIRTQQQTLQWLKEKGELVLATHGGKVITTDTSGTLEGVVNRTAEQFQVKISRLQPQGDELHLWLDTIPFDDLLRWLATLTEQYGIQTKVIEIARDPQHSGHVKVRRLQLSRTI